MSAPIAAPGAGAGRSGRVGLWLRGRGAAAGPVLAVVLAIFALWYVGTVALNAQWTLDQAARADREVGFAELVADTMAQDRPMLPAPHQVAVELYDTVIAQEITSRRSLVYHAWVTLSATLAGFGFGTVLGILLAVGIVHNRAMDMSVMPWAIASQTIPILAIAPMIIVVLNSIGIQGIVPKAIISAYLSFFPVVVGMVSGLRSPGAMQMDLLRTYSASRGQVFWKLRLPASIPYLFASLKVGIAASLVGAIVGELPTGAVQGLGARLLSGSYYGQTVQIWSALLMAAVCAALLVGAIGAVQRAVLRRMGMDR
ncbi:NitT/TauT family transport system permease protein [Tranquillimonas rosea]|uniref:NitT/TauT family transport system permease protein n=1 Tax=Tranquillimonas rosea TaxID=641238 RepID=A0A1H9QBR2_9RHOB|nr:ABC transporter permease [Tranquillimonas rosea]SER57273.1 NitT/TauT family transport system permease protein [Tranquillimonas rosea]